MILNARHVMFRLLPPRKYDITYLFIFLTVLLYNGDRGSTAVKVLCYKSEW